MDYSISSSVDMVRLRVKVNKLDIVNFFDKLKFKAFSDKSFEIIEYKGTKASGFGYNFNFKTENGSFWMGHSHNAEKPTRTTYLYIEYNPNKLSNNTIINFILSSFFKNLNAEIVSMDLAKDIHLNIYNVVIDSKNKHNIKIFNTPKGKTIYIGSKDGKVKIYDKAKEQKIKDINWTRFEVSIRVERKISDIEFFSYTKKIPEIIIPTYNLFMCPEEKAIIYALQDNIVTLKDFKQYKKDKVKKIMESFVKITFTPNEIKDLINSYLFELLVF